MYYLNQLTNFIMKKLIMLSFVLLCANLCFSQNQDKELTKTEAEDTGLKINRNVFKFGASLGFNYVTANIYDPVLSPIDKSLKLQEVSPLSFLLSTTVIINPVKAYYRELDSSGNPIGEIYAKDYWLSFIATVNLAQFGASQSATFNKKIDGGLGLGIKLNDDFHLALTGEMISVRQLREYITDNYRDKPIEIDGEPLNALDIKDHNFFVDNYYFGLSVKFVYVLIGHSKKPE